MPFLIFTHINLKKPMQTYSKKSKKNKKNPFTENQ